MPRARFPTRVPEGPRPGGRRRAACVGAAAWLLAAACSAAPARSLDAAYEREIGRGDLALRMGFAPDAADHYRSALALRPDDPAALHGLARAHLAAGEGEAALAAFARLERSRPEAVRGSAEQEVCRAMFLAGGSRLRRGDSAGALRLLRRLRALDPDHPGLPEILVDTAFAEAGRLQVAGKTEVAAAVLREVGQAVPETELAFTLAKGLMDRGRVGLAISVLSDAIDRRPEDARLTALMDRALRIRYPRGLPD